MKSLRLPGQPTVWLVSALIVGLTNAPQILAHLGDQQRLSTRLLVHLYDLGYFTALGLTCALGSMATATIRRRLNCAERSLRFVVLLLLAGAATGALVLAQDLDRFVIRHHIPMGPLAFGAVLGAVAFLFLGIGRWLVRGAVTRTMALVVGLAAAWQNAGVLQADYRGTHAFISLAATVLIATAMGGPHRLAMTARVAPWALSVATVVTALVFLVTPPDNVRPGLWVSSGSSVFPLVSGWIPRRSRLHSPRLPIEASPWFQDRRSLPEIRPTQPELLPSHPLVLLLTLEAMRRDVIEDPALTSTLPNLAYIRDHSLWFRDARTPCPSTDTVMISLYTGKYYSQIHYKTISPGLVLPRPDRSPRLPALLGSHGVDTTHVVAFRGLLPLFGVGLDFGRQLQTRANYGRAPEVMQLILKELQRYRGPNSRPLFLQAHFVDSHAPYTAAGKKDTPYQGYLAGLMQIDRELGKLLQYLKVQNLSDRVLLIVGADHGEGFGEHGMNFHGRNVYEEILRIPLMFYAPFVTPGHVTQPVTTLDLSPTILDLFGVNTPGTFMGQSLVPLLRGETLELERPIAADSGRRKQALVFPDGIKVILDVTAQTVEVYDIVRDPKELNNLTDDPSRDLDPYIGATERFFRIQTLRVPGWKPPWRRA